MCNTGYFFTKGFNWMSCNSSGFWSNPSGGLQCVTGSNTSSCEAPPQIPGGFAEQSSIGPTGRFVLHDAVTYQCSVGYTFQPTLSGHRVWCSQTSNGFFVMGLMHRRVNQRLLELELSCQVSSWPWLQLRLRIQVAAIHRTYRKVTLLEPTIKSQVFMALQVIFYHVCNDAYVMVN